jgi:hypothetical protein
MKLYGRNFTLVASLLFITLAITLAPRKGSGNPSFNLRQGTSQEIGPDDDLPILDIRHSDTVASAQKERKHRHSLRQDRQIAELPAGVEPLPLPSHALIRLPAIPVVQSNAVIVGEVTDRRVVMTDDKLGIYSEFSISINKVFKDDQSLLGVGGVLSASRPGGAVRFPSGRVQRYTTSRQGYPQQGKLYILFLKRDEEGDFTILTGYEVKGALVQPLDGKRNIASGDDDLQFGIYRGVSQESFLNDLQRALQQALGGKR